MERLLILLNSRGILSKVTLKVYDYYVYLLAVSYTHLDVYKRQERERERERERVRKT